MQRLILCQNFNPLPPHGGRPYFSISSSSLKLYFNPLPPHGGRRKYPDKSSHHNYISIHSLHTEGDLLRLPSTFRNQNHFNPLPPHGGRHRWNIRNSTRGSISIHSLHTEGDSACEHDCTSYHISIHSLHTEGDTQGIFSTLSESYFNPLPPHGGRPPSFCFPGQFTGFQSTPSTRRETWAGVTEDDFNDISIHSLHTEGDLLRYVHGGCAISISIHSLHTEGDEDGAKHCTNCGISIHSLHTEGDFSMSKRKSILFISIHSLHTEGDRKTAQESVFHFAYPCTILQKRMQKTTFCTRKNDFFRKKGEKFGAKPPASFCAPMIRTDIFPQTSLTESAALPCLWFPLHRYVPPSTDNDFPGNKTAGCPFLYQSPVPADA